MNEFVKSFVYAIAIALLFRSLLFEPFHIPSGSMRGTLVEGDYLFVSKFSYGYGRYSFPLGLPLFDGRLFGSAPERGDVIVFRKPSNPNIDYIKRLVGLPGDVVKVQDGVLYINESAVPKEPVDDYYDEDMTYGVYHGAPQYRETLPNGAQYHVLDLDKFGDVDFTSEYEVPEGYYFFMGDNRDNSVDSRYLGEVGFVPEENLIGRADLLLFSTGKGAQFWEFWRWPDALRDGRSFRWVSKL